MLDAINSFVWKYGLRPWIINIFPAFCLVITLIVLMVQNKKLEKNIKSRFFILAGMELLESICSTADNYLVDFPNMCSLRLVVGTLGYLLRPAMLLLILLIMVRNISFKKKMIIQIPIIVEFVLLVFNLPFKFMFSYIINEENPTVNRFHRGGPVFYYLYAVLIFYAASIIVAAFLTYRKNRTESIVVLTGVGFIILNFIFEIAVIYDSDVREIATAFAIIIYYIFFVSQSHYDEIHKVSLEKERAQTVAFERLLEQVIETLSATIDAKDRYTQGHSSRVAQYSLEIAMRSGFSEDECKQIFYAGLLHDIGKIAIPESIINKPGKLTDEEYSTIKSHPLRGKETLEKMIDMPYLALGAHYHHERYDGKGYPEGLVGQNIPVVGRIIAVADAYDAMTSVRSYRSTLPQAFVREQILKGSGSQFDPQFAKIMLDMIDNDKAYRMKEKSADIERKNEKGIKCGQWWSGISEGIRVTEYPLTLKFKSCTDVDGDEDSVPSLILFDSDDGNVGEHEHEGGKNDFREYAVIGSNGSFRKSDALDMVCRTNADDMSAEDKMRCVVTNKVGTEITIIAARYHNMLSVKLRSGEITSESIIALSDNYSWSYLAVTGEKCAISDMVFSYAEKPVSEGDIPKLGNMPVMTDKPAGDVPNLECDGWGKNFTSGIPVGYKQIVVKYDTKTYPRAKRLWHSSILRFFTSEDGECSGKDFIEYFVLRSDGENHYSQLSEPPEVIVRKAESFKNWDTWFDDNKSGVSCRMTVSRINNRVMFESENAGVSIIGTIKLREDDDRPLYLALGGELCSITGISFTD